MLEDVFQALCLQVLEATVLLAICQNAIFTDDFCTLVTSHQINAIRMVNVRAHF